jgi:nucleotide-binding universal stress UspA family protein
LSFGEGVLLKERVRDLIPEDGPLKFRAVACVQSGPASEEILSLAEELAVDLILLGVKRLPIFLGGSWHPATATACQVISRAICPVLTVRG